MISPAVITLIVLVAAAVLFISEKIPVPLTAMLCLAVLVLTGIVTPADAIAGFSNSTVILLISMILVGGALFETGVTEKVAKAALKVAKTEKQMIMVVFWLGVVLSALLNNTGVMAMMIPLLLGLQASVGYSASKLMMAGFLGVMCGGRLTLVGDATVNSIAQNAIVELGGTFGAFDIGRIGLPITILTFLWLLFYGWKKLPDCKTTEDSSIFNSEEKKSAPPVAADRIRGGHRPGFRGYVCHRQDRHSPVHDRHAGCHRRLRHAHPQGQGCLQPDRHEDRLPVRRHAASGRRPEDHRRSTDDR